MASLGMVARYPGRCAYCERPIHVGHPISPVSRGWVHAICRFGAFHRMRFVAGEPGSFYRWLGEFKDLGRVLWVDHTALTAEVELVVPPERVRRWLGQDGVVEDEQAR